MNWRISVSMIISMVLVAGGSFLLGCLVGFALGRR